MESCLYNLIINVKKTYDQRIVKILTGNFPVSSYDKLLDDWYKNGGGEIKKPQKMQLFIFNI